MSVAYIDSLGDIADDYDLYLLDLWGVVHNGVRIYEGAADCMSRLMSAGKRVVLLSNAPRPGRAVAVEILKYGIQADLYDEIITSGDLTQNAMRKRDDPWHARLGRRYYHLGPERSQSLLDGIDGEAVAVEDAEYLLVSGVVDDSTEQAEDYRAFLTDCRDRGLPMVCANPDKVVMRGTDIIPCAGAVADLYEELGGDVVRHGKPYAGAYDTALRHADGIPRRRSLMVGDTFYTDIAGGRQVGMGTLWIAGGIHVDDVSHDGRPFDRAKADAVIAKSGETPDYALFQMIW